MVERTLTLEGFHPLRFFAKLGKREKNAAYFSSGEWKIICWNPVRTITGNDEKVFVALKKLTMKKSSLPFAGGAIGYCSYDLGCVLQGVALKHRSALPLAVFHVYDSALLWNGKKLYVVGDSAFSDDVESIHTRPFSDVPLRSIEWKSTLPKQAYRTKFRAAMRCIRSGAFYQLNLSYPFTAYSDDDPRHLFAAIADTHAAPCASYFEHDSTALISLSPERFVTIEDGIITTRPIKGTRPRGRTPAEDRRLSSELRASPKETAELTMITDLLRNDVGKVSDTGSVKVLEHRTLQKNSSVWHTYSVISGILEKKLHPVDAFASMFPGGSVTGCPKVAAMREIDRLESRSRGAYCGSMVMISANGLLDSTMLIRTVVKSKRTLTLSVGGGIVADSDCMDEYDETLKKAQQFLEFSALQTPQYFRNGRKISPSDVRPMFNPGNRRTVGIFETMRADNTTIRDLRAHVARLTHSAALLGVRIPSSARLTRDLRTALRLSVPRPLRVKIVCTKNDVVIETRPIRIDPVRSHGISAIIVPLDRAHPEAKSLPYHREYAAHQRALQSGCGEALLLRSDGSISEGAYSNIFFVKDKTLWTAETDILFGITRASVIRLAKRLEIPVRYVSLHREDISHADEVFITSSLSGITPVVMIDSKKVGDGRVGPITKKLLSCYTHST